MKRTIAAAAIIMAGILTAVPQTGCRAQDSSALMSKIESANSTTKVRTGKFTEERNRKGKAPQSLAGELTFDPAGKLSMNYSTPAGDVFNIADGFIVMKNNGVDSKFDLSKNKPMKQLSDLLLSSFSGKMQDFALQNACTLDVEKTASSIKVTVSATKKGVRGYSVVVSDYDLKTGLLMSMRMEEFDGSVTVYQMK